MPLMRYAYIFSSIISISNDVCSIGIITGRGQLMLLVEEPRTAVLQLKR